MTTSTSLLRETCSLLGGLSLEGASIDLLSEIKREGTPARLSAGASGVLALALGAMQDALGAEEPAALALDYTRLLLADGEAGARRPVVVPPWEDCYTGDGRVVMGPRSQAALRAYAAARLGFDGMTGQPADHIGLELCFVAALLDEEERGQRDGSTRTAFVAEHLQRFAPAFGEALSTGARSAFWREVGRAIAALPGVLAPAA